MKLAYALTSHYIDAAKALNDGVVKVNGETVYSAHIELNSGDVVEIAAEVKNKWVIE